MKKPKTEIFLYEITETGDILYTSIIEGGVVEWMKPMVVPPLHFLKMAFQEKICIWPKSQLDDKKRVEESQEKTD